jgi:hypothetical protein
MKLVNLQHNFSRLWDKVVINHYVIKLLIVLIVYLLLSQVINFIFRTMREGMTSDNNDTDKSKTKYTDYDLDDPGSAMILAQKNAGNIQAIKDMITGISELKEMVDENTSAVKSVQTQVNDLAEAQNSMAGDMVGTDVPEISD